MLAGRLSDEWPVRLGRDRCVTGFGDDRALVGGEPDMFDPDVFDPDVFDPDAFNYHAGCFWTEFSKQMELSAPGRFEGPIGLFPPSARGRLKGMGELLEGDLAVLA